MTHICVSKLTIIGSDNGLSPVWRQAIIWSNAGILLNWTLGTNFSEIFSEIDIFSFKQMRLKMSSGKWRPYCLGLNVLKKVGYKCNVSIPASTPQYTHGSALVIFLWSMNNDICTFSITQELRMWSMLFSELWIKIWFLLKKIHLKMSSA